MGPPSAESAHQLLLHAVDLVLQTLILVYPSPERIVVEMRGTARHRNERQLTPL